jgi:hypothetical protein
VVIRTSKIRVPFLWKPGITFRKPKKMRPFRKNITPVALTMIYCSILSAQNNIRPFTVAPPIRPAPPTAKITSFKSAVTAHKVLLDWTVTDNQDADMFEVERSTDNGKTFVMAALVFATCKMDTDSYRFYEKKKQAGTVYRIKIICRNRTVQYSPVITAEQGNIKRE